MSRQIIPYSLKRSFRYATLLRKEITTANNGYTSHLFRSNSIFDPDETAIGHQPMGRDEWAQFYNTYTVLQSRITAIFHVDDADLSFQSGGVVVGIYADAGGDPISTYDTSTYLTSSKMENPRSVYTTIGPTNSPYCRRTLRYNYDAGRFWRLPHPLGEEELEAGMQSNPAASSKFLVWMQTAAVSSTVTFEVTVVIDYIVMLRQPVPLLQS